MKIGKNAEITPFRLIVGVIILLAILAFLLIFSYTQTGSITSLWQGVVTNSTAPL